ncbi:MAG: hypothetical protein ACPGVI_02450 [Crocinitomicaceae bacterium]
MSKSIHIVALDVPYPLDYGGAIDMFYRLKALHELGYKITLHCFEYGRGKQRELEKYSDNVIYYSRKKSALDWLSKIPFIVKSRSSETLLANLLKDNSPILFEGIHCTAHLNNPKLKDRVKLVRCHNIEHDYYDSLAKRAKGLKRIFYSSEAKKLRSYESELSGATALLAIQNKDLDHFKAINSNTVLLPASLPELEIKGDVQTEDFGLFHGNLSVSENENAATWIIENVTSKIADFDFRIAGKNPSKSLIELCKKHDIELIENPSDEAMNKLITSAKVHIQYTDQPTGLKLKLLNALMSNGAVIVNPDMVAGSDLNQYCTLANSPIEFIQAIKSSTNSIDTDARHKAIQSMFDTTKNCQLIEELTQK